MKTFYIQYRIGKSKYIVNYHDGIKTHADGSSFFDIQIFKNKKKLLSFVEKLIMNSYTEQ